MLSRRQLLQATAIGVAMSPAWGQLLSVPQDRLAWQHFLEHMQALANRRESGTVAADELATEAVALVSQLDIHGPGFSTAIESAWESGNRFWLWQRLTREAGLLGGILTIEQGRPVPLHDHPGATGILRILSGTAEVWQFDRLADDNGYSELQRVSRRMLQPGDTAVLQPANGNIHALRSHSAQCSMLDYFIPPYERRLRNWYLPVQDDWTGLERITCQRIAEQDFYIS